MTSRRLIVFTRYPEPGRTKTRLIPALGAENACLVHRRLAELAIVQARQACRQTATDLEVHHAGGDPQRMARWLGQDLIYREQQGADLGARMARTFDLAFGDGTPAAIIMGTDCPDLTAPALAEAFALLQAHDLVLGPSLDGGYYLIGLARSAPDLFAGIAWGTNQVLARTISLAAQLELRTALLPRLGDIDRPEDLSRLPFLAVADQEKPST